MRCEVEYTDEFEEWWNALNESEQAAVDAYVKMLEEFGIASGYPYSSDIKGSKYPQMRELRPQHKGKPYRVYYMHSIREEWLYCLSAAIKPEKIAGMKNSFPSPTSYTKII